VWSRSGTSVDEDGRVTVDGRQVVRDSSGALIKDDRVCQFYRIEHGLIRSMEIRPTRQLA
jgi:hypothetical protein